MFEDSGHPGWSSSKTIFLQDRRVARLHWPPDRCCADFRLQLLGLLRVVAMAHNLPEQIAWPGQEGSRRLRLDARPAIPQGRLRGS